MVGLDKSVSNETASMEGLFYLLLSLLIQQIVGNKTEPNYYRYLQQFGYTPKLEGRRLFSVVSENSYEQGIRTFQRLYKLPVCS